MDQHQIIQQLEEHAENIIKKTRKYLPHIGRFCLISTFVEDGIRMINQWGEQRDYIGKSSQNSPTAKISNGLFKLDGPKIQSLFVKGLEANYPVF